jgi:putative transposase
MPEKFLNKYRIPSARLQDWDYKSAAPYFVTICTHNREHYFGEIRDGEMQLSAIGQIVEAEWTKTPAIRPDMNLELGEFVVMPNHFHGILIIGENEFNTTVPPLDRNSEDINTGMIDDSNGNVEMRRGRTLEIVDECRDVGRDAMHCVSTAERVPPPLATTYATKNKFAPQSKNLASIIRGFKSSVTTQVKKLYGNGDANDITPFAWQPRFHDHIIRDAESFEHIQNYIANNPLNWMGDKFYDGK